MIQFPLPFLNKPPIPDLPGLPWEQPSIFILIVPSEGLSHCTSVDDRLYKLVSNKTKLVN